MATSPPAPSDGADRTRRILVLGVIAIVLAIAVGAFLVWFVFFSSTAPPPPTIEDAAELLLATPAPGE